MTGASTSETDGATGPVRLLVPLAWGLGILFPLLFIANDWIAWQSGKGLSLNGAVLWGRDFVNVYSAGRLVLEDKLSLLYDIPAYQAWQAAAFPEGLQHHNYSYPPTSLLYTPLFGALPYLAALALWTSLSLFVFAWAAKPWLARIGYPAAAALLLPASLICVWTGHYGLIAGALWLAIWRNIEDRPKLAGILTGLMLIKPHLAVLMPLMLLKRRAWTAIAWAAGTVGVLVALSIAFFGAGLWETYLTSTSQSQLAMLQSTQTFFAKMMPSLPVALHAYGIPADSVLPLHFAVAAVTVILLWRFQPDEAMDAALAGGTATFLILPYAFNYDMTVVCLGALTSLTMTVRRGWAIGAVVAALAFVLPAIIIHVNIAGLWVAPFILTALFVFQLKLVRQ